MNIIIFDLDGTVFQSEEVIHNAQAFAILRNLIKTKNKGFLSIFSSSFKEKTIYSEKKAFLLENSERLKENLTEEELKSILDKLEININDFFKIYYKNPWSNLQKGELKTYSDALELFKKLDKHDIKIAISNSGKNATQAKLESTGLENFFDYVDVTYTKEEGKPSTHMFKKVLAFLKSKDMIPENSKIIFVGDQENDLLFAENSREIYPNIENVLIKRKGSKVKSKPDRVILSLEKLI
jgi:HAD superfamily hydrolase (TIGR01549 family)